jgi:hypothetical protein
MEEVVSNQQSEEVGQRLREGIEEGGFRCHVADPNEADSNPIVNTRSRHPTPFRILVGTEHDTQRTTVTCLDRSRSDLRHFELTDGSFCAVAAHQLVRHGDGRPDLVGHKANVIPTGHTGRPHRLTPMRLAGSTSADPDRVPLPAGIRLTYFLQVAT